MLLSSQAALRHTFKCTPWIAAVLCSDSGGGFLLFSRAADLSETHAQPVSRFKSCIILAFI